MAIEAAEHSATRSLSLSERTPSRHSSIQGPYRDGMKEATFPVYRTVELPGKSTSSIYVRSLLGTGNGIALSDPIGNRARPAVHLKNGTLLGDVGYVDKSGYFNFNFNIFTPSDHPLHEYGVPDDFSPALPGLSAEDSVIIPNFHPPGTVITSPGIKMTQVSDPPAIQFETAVLEGSVLILPDGATREDLVDPPRLYSYLKKHAASWYRYYNGRSDQTAHDGHTANGTLCIVTGVDRVESWATATFPSSNYRIGKGRQFRYIAQSPPSWKNDIGSTHFESKNLTDGSRGVIFLRVLTIALSPGEWSRNVAYIPPEEIQSYVTLSTRMFGLGARIQRALPRIYFFSKQHTWEDSEIMFNPSIILLNILILTDASAAMAIVPDSIWSSQLSGPHLTYPEVVVLIRKVIDNCDIENRNGIAMFSQRKVDDKDQASRLSKSPWMALSLYARWMTPWVERSKPKDLKAKALGNMNKVLST